MTGPEIETAPDAAAAPAARDTAANGTRVSASAGGAAPLVEAELVDLGVGDAQAAVLWLNRPEVLNAMSWDMVLAIEGALARAETDERVAAILISGRGRGFSAGGDLKGYLELQQDAAAFRRFIGDLTRAFAAIKLMSKPVVALVNGVTVAGGLELMLACDFAFAAASAEIGDGHLNYAQIGGGGSLALLPRMIGPARARELLFSARLLAADDALAWGLVNRVVPDGELLEAGLEFARGVAEKSPAAVAHLKYALNASWADATGLEAAYRLENTQSALYCLSLPDSREGLEAFAEKRKPRYRGR